MRSITGIWHYLTLLVDTIIHACILRKRAIPLILSIHLMLPTLSTEIGGSFSTRYFYLILSCLKVSSFFLPLSSVSKWTRSTYSIFPGDKFFKDLWTLTQLRFPGPCHQNVLINHFFALDLEAVSQPLWAEPLTPNYTTSFFSLGLILVAWLISASLFFFPLVLWSFQFLLRGGFLKFFLN